MTETAAEHQEAGERFVFCLYTAGHSRHSVIALRNLTAICAAHLPGRHEIEVVDLVTEPGRAKENEIIVVPTLVRVRPEPALKLIGDLSETSTVVGLLELELPERSGPWRDRGTRQAR